MTPSRRQFVATASLAALATLVRAELKSGPTIITNVYPWTTFASREKKDFYKDLDGGLAQVKAAGLDGFEPVLTTLDAVKTLGPLLKKHD